MPGIVLGTELGDSFLSVLQNSMTACINFRMKTNISNCNTVVMVNFMSQVEQMPNRNACVHQKTCTGMSIAA